MAFAIIGDLHFGMKEDYPKFVDYQWDIFNESIETIYASGIKTVILLGDITDNRRYITYPTLKRLSSGLIYPDINYIIIVGNHDCFYKNTNKLNSIRELFGNFNNVKIIDCEPETILIDNNECLFVPFITNDNYDMCLSAIKNSSSDYCFGHFDLNGAIMSKGITSESPLNVDNFVHFTKVFSGHFHTPQTIKNFIYVGSLFQLTWNDYDDIKSFMIVENNIISEYHTKNIYIKILIDNEFKFDNLEEYKDKFLKIYIYRKLSPSEEKKLTNIIEYAIKVETIDNTVLSITEETDICNDEEFSIMVNEFTKINPDIPETLKSRVEELIIQEYNFILEGI